MKFYVGSKESGEYYKNKIKKMIEDDTFVSLAKITEIFRGKAKNEERQIGWDKNSNICRKMRVRQCKDGWYLYLPEPNVKLWFDDPELHIPGNENVDLPDIDVCVFETELFEKLVKAIDDGFTKLLEGEQRTTDQTLEYLYNSIIPSFFFCTRPCIVKAKKSGRKEERQDRNAKFHRWADLSKGVQQVVAIVEFEDGHVEQVKPDRVIFKEVEEND